MSLSLQRLNENQRQAVLHFEGPLLLLAGAGSGKTNTMAYRMAHLVSARGVSPSQILGLSFTNKAANELRDRVKKLLQKAVGPSAARGLTVSTFHSLCVKILREQAPHLGFSPQFSILDSTDQTDLIKRSLRDIKLDDHKFDADIIRFEIGQAKNRFLKGEAAQQFFLDSGRMKSDYAIVTTSVYERYQAQLKIQNSMDFDDLLFYTVELMRTYPGLREFYSKKFRFLLVDEYQDTNPAQFKILEALTSEHQNLCVVGDDDQSIYGWRGADPAHILHFDQHYAEVRTITLEQNYRSTQNILDAANAVIRNNTKRHDKKLWSDKGVGEPVMELICEDDRKEAEIVAEEILNRVWLAQRKWSEFAILYRSNTQSRVFEEALRMRKIPYTIVGGLSFLERREIKDVLSYLRVLVNPKDDQALRRIINWPTRGIGKSSLEVLSQHAIQAGIPMMEAFEQSPELAPRAVTAVGGFLAELTRLRAELETTAPTPESMVGWARRVFTQFQIQSTLLDEAEDPAQGARRWDNVEELLNALGQFDPGIASAQDKGEAVQPESGQWTATEWMREFLARMQLQSQDEKDKNDDGPDKKKEEVTLLTLHGAKGLEYPIVFMVGVEDGLLPHQRVIDELTDLSEERRLAYVGITRAKEQLIITRARTRVRFGKVVLRTPSRFLAEIPRELVLTQDLSTGENATVPGAAVQAQAVSAAAHEERVKGFLASIKAQLQKN